MGWPFGKKSQARQESPKNPKGLEPEIQRSPALAALLPELKGGKVEILDLGSASGSNVEFLSPLGCKLYIEDLYAALSSRQPHGSEGEIAGPEFFSDFLSVPEETRFDAIFAWDLFNYLKREELVHFAARLDQFCQPGTRIFTLISYLKQMPAQPLRFRFQDEGNLVYEKRTTTERPSPRLATSELPGLLGGGFRVYRSFLLRNGFQEHLLIKE